MLAEYSYINFSGSDTDITKKVATLFIADKLAWSPGGNPPYYESMLKALNISLEASCYEYVKYMESEGKMFSVHEEWAKAVRWLKTFVV